MHQNLVKRKLRVPNKLIFLMLELTKEEKLPDALPSFRPSWMQPVSQNKPSQIKEDEEVILAPQGGFSAQKKHKPKEVLRKVLEGASRERGVIEQVKDKVLIIDKSFSYLLVWIHSQPCFKSTYFLSFK